MVRRIVRRKEDTSKSRQSHKQTNNERTHDTKLRQKTRGDRKKM